jgi:ankyrin repeat protein
MSGSTHLLIHGLAQKMRSRRLERSKRDHSRWALSMLRSFSRYASYAIYVIALWASACMAIAEPATLTPKDLQLMKAVRSGDISAVQNALAAGGHIRRSEFEFPLMPIGVAVLFDQRNVLPLLVTDQDSADDAYAYSIMSANVAAFESLLTIRAPSPKVISSGLRLFAARFSIAMTETFKSSINHGLGDGGKPPDPPWWFAIIPTPLASADAPQLRIAKKLRELGSDAGADDSNNPLLRAAWGGDIYFVDWLVSQGLGTMTDDLRAQLMEGTVNVNFLDGFEVLVDRGQLPTDASDHGMGLLKSAAEKRHSAFVHRLLQLGVPVGAASGAASSQQLVAAVHGGSVTITQNLISAGAKMNVVDEDGKWPLREAARAGNKAIVSLLLNAGADAKLVDSKGNTALHGFTYPAAETAPTVLFGLVPRVFTKEHVEATRMLVAAGLDVNAKNAAGVSVMGSLLADGQILPDYWTEIITLGAQLDASCYLGVVDTYEVPAAKASWFFNAAGADLNYVLPPPFSVSLVEYTGNQYFSETLETLFAMGAKPPNTPDRQAALLQKVLTAPRLTTLAAGLARGLSPNLVFSSGTSALESAVEHNDVSIVRLLLDAGADVNVAGNVYSGGGILHSLLRNDDLGEEQLESISLLIERGLDLELKDNDGKTFFDLAMGSPNKVAILTQAVAQAGSSTDPVHNAVRRANLVDLQALVMSGANIEVKDTLGRTPLSVSLATGQVAITRYLLRKGAAISATSSFPGIATDLSYSTDPRFSAFFHPRLLAGKLIDISASPASDLEKFATSEQFRLGPMIWQIGCQNGCENETVLKDTAHGVFDLVRAERTDERGRSVVSAYIPIRTEEDVSGSSIVAGLIRKIIREGIWTIRGNWTIESCAFTFKEPFCFPEVTVEVIDLPGGSILLKDANLTTPLKEGDSRTVERGSGPIIITINPTEGRSPRAQLAVTYGLRPNVNFIPGVSFAARMQTYSELAKLSIERDLLLKNEDQLSLARAMSVAAAIRELSSRAAVENYELVVRELFHLRAQDLVALDQRVLDLRAVLQSQLSFPSADVQLVIKTVDDLVKTDPNLASILIPVRDALKASLDASKDGQAATGKAIENLFSDVDRVVFEYQGFGLEVAQFMSAELIESEGLLTATQRTEIGKRLTGSDSWVQDNSFDGQGVKIKHALAFP